MSEPKKINKSKWMIGQIKKLEAEAFAKGYACGIEDAANCIGNRPPVGCGNMIYAKRIRMDWN